MWPSASHIGKGLGCDVGLDMKANMENDECLDVLGNGVGAVLNAKADPDCSFTLRVVPAFITRDTACPR